MKIAFIHNDKKIGTGAHFINDLIASKLREHGADVQNFYPKFLLTDTPIQFKGINNILFFYSLLEKREEILRCDIIQGTTYTPLAFLRFSHPIVSHFGSTTIGFLRTVPRTRSLEDGCREIFYQLKKEKAIKEIDLKTRRPLNDIASIEQYAAERVDYVIATSEIVKNDLTSVGISPKKIVVIHNAIEDYWFEPRQVEPSVTPSIIFLGRIGEDSFTLKIKGIDRLIWLFQKFPEISKFSVVMSRNKLLLTWLRTHIPNHTVVANAVKTTIPSLLQPFAGGISFLPSRYEGFSLSLIETMSQQFVPVAYSIGIVPEIIRNGENGFIVDSLEEAEEKIRLLLDNPDLRRKLSINAQKTAEQFRSDILSKKMVSLYNRILNENRPKNSH